MFFFFVSGEDKESGDVLRERCSKEACERGGTRRVSDDIMPHILNLYVF